MDNLVNIQFPVRGQIRSLKGTLEVHLPRAVDYALSAERQLWRLLASNSDDADHCKLALLVAVGNIEDSIKNLNEIKRKLDDLLGDLKK